MEAMESILNLSNKKVAIFGMGVSGLSALRLVNSLGAQAIAINGGEVSTWATKESGVLNYIEKENCFNENDPKLVGELNAVDLLILSPGIPREHVILAPLHKKAIPVWGEIELAYRYLHETKNLSPIVGITGTNGKTTITTFLGEMLETCHKSVFVGGNIGIPFCDYAYELSKGGNKRDVVVLELSSFQLESIDHFHVNIALMLNLFQNHGERYERIEDYAKAKFNIVNRFTEEDVLIFAQDFELINKWSESVIGKKMAINTQKLNINFDLKNFKLPGHHNLVNLNFIILVAEVLKLNHSGIQKCIDEFKGVHHRIEFVPSAEELSHLKIYNDAKSTNWDATITAVTAMSDFKLPIHLIIGGKKRGHGDSILPYMNFLTKNVTKLYLIGEMAFEIMSEIENCSGPKIDFEFCETLEKCKVSLMKIPQNQKAVVLFSPAFPSFDQFKNYAHRGETFVGLLTRSNNSGTSL